MDWDWTDARRNVEGPVEHLSPDIDRTVIEILALGGLLMATHVVPASGPQTLTNAQIVNALGAEYHFILRAWFESNGRRSLESDSLTVRKV